mmetsp:Transcript_129383/g.258307  ORF Transcript_129383/g.258307 Transcript_129383/m.258307 type:complete len:293 (-) Transcript_129383:35-913(-)
MLADWLGYYEDGVATPMENASVPSTVSLSSEDAHTHGKHPLKTLAHALMVATPPEALQAQMPSFGGTGSAPSVFETSMALPEAAVSMGLEHWASLGVRDMIEMLTCMPTVGKTSTTDDALNWLLSFRPRSENRIVTTDDVHTNSVQPQMRADTGTDLAANASSIPETRVASGEEEYSSNCQPHATESTLTTSTPVLSEQSFTPRDCFEDHCSSRSSGPSAHGNFDNEDGDTNFFDTVGEWELEFFLRAALSDICQHLKLRKKAEAHKLICETRAQLQSWREQHQLRVPEHEL